MKRPGGTRLDASLAGELERDYPIDETYLVAVSGGKDSMALLHFLREAGYRNLIVCHLNHQLRGEDSELDAELVKVTTAACGFPFHTQSVNVEAAAKDRKESLETVARDLRYRFFGVIARETGVHRIFLAHHADDQVETILMNFFRGAGPSGLTGMKEESAREVEGLNLELLRPFLSVFRSEIDRYVEENAIPYREDLSNQSDFALRNRVRNQLIPEITRVFEKDVRLSVLRSAALLGKQEETIGTARPEIEFQKKKLSIELLRSLPEDWRSDLLLRWLRFNRVPDCGFEEIRKVTAIALSDTNPAKTNLPNGIHARRKEGVLFLDFPAD